MGHAFLRPAKLPGAEGAVEDQIVHHLVKGAPDDPLGKAGGLYQLQSPDLTVVKGPAEDGDGDGGGEKDEGEAERGEDG